MLIATTVVLTALLVVVGLVLRMRSARTSMQGIAGTIAVVATAIPAGGVGRIAHARRGHFARLPARDTHGGALAAGRPVVVVTLERGVASVAALPPDVEEAFQ